MFNRIRRGASQVSFRELLFYMGPGFLISVAYMDPGNWATNISGGARFGPALLWVIVAASLLAIVIQINAAKLGIATGSGVARHCRDKFSKPVVYLLWGAAELAMIGTDIAEIIGAAIGFSLVFKLPLWAGAILAAVSSLLLLGVRSLHKEGYRTIEFIIIGMVAVVSLAFVFEVFLARPAPAMVLSGLVPSLPGPGALYVAVGILGATVMPHSVYLHSTLVQDRRERLVETRGDNDASHRHHFRLEAIDTSAALFAAMFVNAAMLIVAAAALQGTGISSLEDAYITLENIFGRYSSLAFGLALIAAGLSSSLVATMAGQTVMDGFLDLKLNVWIRRLATLAPSLFIVMMGFDPTDVLVASQVALSLELPFALIPLLWLTNNSELMGSFKNRTSTTITLAGIIGLISLLNIWLIYESVSSWLSPS